jgi:UDP-sulfoquinovose synthase
MKIAVLGGDGYCGWATALYLSKKGHSVSIVDSFARRQWDYELGVQTLTPILPLPDRLRAWHQHTGKTIELYVGDVTDYEFLSFHHLRFRTGRRDPLRGAAFRSLFHDRPAATPSFTQVNNVVGTLNLLFALRELRPDCHLIKLGTMGEYGTPNIDIEEGYIAIEHNGRKDVLPIPEAARLFLSPVESSRQPQHHVRLQNLEACAPPT